MNKVVFFLIIALVFGIGCARKADKAEVSTNEEISEDALTAPTTLTENKALEVVSPQPTTTPATNISIEPATQPSPTTSAVPENPSVENIQQALKNAGFYTGKVDGKLGPKTKKAIQDFQAKNSLKADGKIGPKTCEKLKTYLTAKESSSLTKVQ
jgi:peptidoglycan hydrolase-like protein with peptidoglycan-binding domain